MAEGGVEAEGEERGHLIGVGRARYGANEVDAAVDLVEAVVVEAEVDLAGRDPRLEQLPPRDHPVLPGRQGREDAIREASRRFTTHSVVNPVLG